jgi:hypothetical protein
VSKRKYEQGGGVVPTEWQKGEVPTGERWGIVLREVWTLDWDWQGVPEVVARVEAYRWPTDGNMWEALNGMPRSGRVVRWLRVGARCNAHLPLTLKEWPRA